MLGGMGYATTSAAMADDAEPTLEQQAGISMGLHDYNRNTINDGHALWFKNSGSQNSYNRYVGSGKGAYTGIVNTTLRNGYPTMAADKGSESLDYLFGGKPDIAVTSYKPTGGLLTLDNDGYYGFDAASHYASYDKASNRFTLTDKQCGDNVSTPCFTPFGNDTSDNRYSFGMNLGADFYMPKDGKVNNRDMVFDFTGDDDVWVFIDGVLVLDLGGIHDASHGSIDFATGAITYDTTPYQDGQPAGTISQAFDNAGKTWDSTPYKIHHLSFFYLERGDGGSNCKIRFNLPVKPSKAIDIEKQTLGTIEADKQFQFQLFVDGSSTPYQGKYSVYDAYTNQVESDKQTGDNGVITLTKGQFARVQSDTFTDDTEYTVRELNSSGYTVSANGSPMTQQGGGDNAYAETDSFTVGKTSHVTIVNSNVKPSNNKSIVKTNGGKGDEYTLNLTASGDSTSSTVTTVTPADIVLVMDKSGSMNKDNRDTNAQNAANALAKKLLTDKNSKLPTEQQVQMAVVTFSDSDTLKQGFTTSASNIESAVSQTPYGGTNWEAALKRANGLQGRSGVKKHIIFLSDGNPTFRISNYPIGCSKRCNPDDNWFTTPQGVHGAGTEGSDNHYGYNYAAALAEANRRESNVSLYVVKASPDANRMSDFASEASAVNGKEFDGTNADNLTKAFNQIYSSITSSAKIKVFSITDTLSNWVDPVDFADAANGDITQYVTVKNGNTTLKSGYTATYNSDSRTVTVTFNGTGGIVVDKTDPIDVSFKVKPSDAAYADYAKSKQYPNKGEANTGTESDGQQGYYSNKDAKLNYCVLTEVNGVTSCEPTEAEYPHPVVQVKLGKIKITKQWSDDNSKHANDSVTVQLQRKAIGAADSTAENVGNPITLNAANNWTTTVDNLVPDYTYSVVETSGDDRYAVSYTGNNADLTKEMAWSSNADAGTLNATIANTRKTVSLNNAISVKKNLTGREWKDSDQFDFTLEAENDAPLPASCKDQQSCTVTVKHDSSSHTESFGDITYNAGADTYTYYVTENSGNITALHYSQAEYQVVVAVCKKGTTNDWEAVVKSVTKTKTDSGVEGAWSEDKTQPMTFTNQYISASSLPLTGRMGAERWWQLAASGIGVLALLAVVAADQWRRKKRLS